MTLLLSSGSIPTENPSIASMSSLPPSMSGTNDQGSVYSATSYGNRAPSRATGKHTTSMHLLSSSGSQRGTSVGGKSARSASTAGGKSAKGTIGGKSIAPSIPQHKIEFEQFHNQVSRRELSLRGTRRRAPSCR